MPERSVSDSLLIDRLAQKVLHWRIAPGRYLTGNRSWIPRWRFNPLQRIDDAFMLLDNCMAVRYLISQTGGKFQVEVENDGKIGWATGGSKPRAVTLALARSFGWEL